VPGPVAAEAESDLPTVIDDALRRYDEHMLALQLQPALVAVWDIVDRANHYLVEKEPWKLAKDPARRDELASVLYAAAETLRVLAVAIAAIMPSAAAALWGQLGIESPLDGQRLPAAGVWGGLEVGTRTTKGESLFPRLEVG
jgi:methionyl-tRNA synthetase